MEAVARDAGSAYRTVQRWKRRYRKYGLPGLARDDRSDQVLMFEGQDQNPAPSGE